MVADLEQQCRVAEAGVGEHRNVKVPVSEQTNFDLRRICGIVHIEQVPEEQRSRHSSRFPIERPVPLALRGPSAI